MCESEKKIDENDDGYLRLDTIQMFYDLLLVRHLLFSFFQEFARQSLNVTVLKEYVEGLAVQQSE